MTSVLKKILLLTLVTLAPVMVYARPKVLEKRPVASPEGTRYANVEWEDVGFVGIIRMKVWNSSGQLTRVVELPQINPEPASLMWLDEEWVACESFIGSRGSGFFYVHAPTGRAYLLEIVAPNPSSKWLFLFACNDAISTSSVSTISRGHTSYFPLLLRDCPEDGADYFTVEFAEQLADAADAFRDFRKKRKIREMEPLSEADIQADVGAVALFRINRQPRAVYFPTQTTTPQEMLSRTQWIPVPPEAATLIGGPDPPKVIARWLDGGQFVLEGIKPTFDNSDNQSSRTLLMHGRFENAHDEPLVSEGAEQTEEASEPEDKVSSREGSGTNKSKKSSSGKKRPSASR